MQNLGKANAKVLLSSSLPNVTKDRQFFDFDFSASSWPMIEHSPYLPPLLIENVTDELSGFSVLYPSKRKLYLDNYITDGSGSPITTWSYVTSPYILWTPTVSREGIINQLITDGKFNTYTLLYPKTYPSVAGAYNGPQWEDAAREREPYPNDTSLIKQWFALASSVTTTPTTTTSTTTTGPIPKTNFINQTVTRDGLWWGVESNDFLNENMPFWVTIKRTIPPSSATHDTFLIISLGIGVDDNAYDIYICNNKKPLLIDYYKGRAAMSASSGSGSGASSIPPNKMYEFNSDLAKIFETDLNLEIGFMTIGGRFIISVNKVVQVFTRINTASSSGTTGSSESGGLQEFKIAPGRLRIYGSNTQAVINVCPMVFATFGCASLPVPVIPASAPISSPGATGSGHWKNIKYDGTTGTNSVCLLPRAPSIIGRFYGVDCYQFTQDLSILDSPSGFGFHKRGYIDFTPSSTIMPVSDETDFYMLIMQPDNSSATFSGETWAIPNGGCPYFFRIKGGLELVSSPPSTSVVDVSEDVISVSEDYQIDDYFAINGSANVVLYNKGGKYDSLRNKQKGITIAWGWNNTIKTFTGLIVSTSVSETPGNEQITLNCHDYMYILKNTPMVNSPFYDGMVLFYAIRNIVRRGGINSVLNNWDHTDDYFLPTGYSFTKPAVKFEDTQTLYDCAKSIAERGEATFYFDQNGICRVKKLPGGLFSERSIVPTAVFTRNPNAIPSTVILNEKNIEYDYSDTVNRIVIATLDRDTRNAILVTKDAPAGVDKLLYRRIGYEEQAALGNYDVAVARADELGQRVFRTIRKTSFQTVGAGTIIYPLSFITVDGDEFRLIGISRKYSADNNDFVMDFNCEWLGG